MCAIVSCSYLDVGGHPLLTIVGIGWQLDRGGRSGSCVHETFCGFAPSSVIN